LHAGNLYVAYIVDEAVDVIDCPSDLYLYSIPNFTGITEVLLVRTLSYRS